jgi:hypothetical protein
MDRFLADAQGLLETACAAGGHDADLAILVGAGGSIQIVDAVGIPLAALRMNMGALTAYRVRQTSKGVQVEGRTESRCCILEAESPSFAARRLLMPRNAANPLVRDRVSAELEGGRP